MSEKKIVAETTAETKKKTIAEITAETKETLKAEVKRLVDKWNESNEFGEYKRMKALEAKISEAVEKYNAECERECFRELETEDDPMKAVALVQCFGVMSVKVKKKKGVDGKPTGETEMQMGDGIQRIDPYRLHKFVDGGIGADKLWVYKVERLNMLFTAYQAARTHAIGTDGKNLDFQTIRDTIAMSEESRKLSLSREDERQNEETLLENTQAVLTAMLGEGYTATPQMVEYLIICHTKGGRDPMTFVCSNKRTMRQYMLDCCHAAITGDAFIIDYKKRRK